MKEALDAFLQAQVDEQNLPGVNVLIYHKGKEWYYGQAGLRDREQKLPVERDTIFRYYSLSKPITGAAVFLLLERGLLHDSDRVSQYLPSFSSPTVLTREGEVPAWRELRIRDLLNMTGGLSYGKSPLIRQELVDLTSKLEASGCPTTQEFASRLGECTLESQPGEHWTYGLAADVLGAIIEIVTGQSLGEFLQTAFFTPLGMKDTGFYVPPKEYHRLTKTYRLRGGEFQLFTKNYRGTYTSMDRPVAFQSAGGGLVGTIDDYLQFARMLMNNGTLDGREILKPSTVKALLTPRLTEKQRPTMKEFKFLDGYNYGNLFRILTHPEQARVNVCPGEYGWDGMMGCHYSADPEQDVIFLLMTHKVNAGTLPEARTLRTMVSQMLGYLPKT